MKIRVGKNIYLSLTVNRLNNAPEDFTDARNTRVVVNRIYSNFQYTPDLIIRDNIISFELPASAGMTTGDYSIHLSYDKLNESSVTGRDTYFIDFCHAFQIVDSTCKEDGCFSVDVPTITFKGAVDVPTIGLNGTIDRDTDGKDGLTPFIGDNGNWWTGDVDTGKPSRGEAFTYEDFTPEQIKELQKPANDMIATITETNEAIKINEIERLRNEGIRQQQETSRVNDEDLRKQAETTRARNEDARNTVESNRVKSEESRGKAESTRIEAEKGRVTAESTRVTNENARETAENSRNTAEQGRVTEFGRLKTESETTTINAKNQGDYAKEQGGKVAGTVQEIKTAQYGLLKRVNDYIYDVSALLGKLAYKGKFTSLLDQFTLNGYYNETGKFVEVIGSFTSTPLIAVNKNAIYHLKQLATALNSYVLNLYDEDGKLIYNLLNNLRQAEGDYIFAGVSKISLTMRSSEVNSESVGYYDLQDITSQGNRALYVSSGAVYNETTGFYELNGLTDITEEQMRDIYNYCGGKSGIPYVCTQRYSNPIRTNISSNVNLGGWTSTFKIDFMCAQNTTLEIFCFTSNPNGVIYITTGAYAFNGCSKLIATIGMLNLEQVNTNDKLYQIFRGCRSLKEVNLFRLHVDISLADSPLISIRSLQYLIDSVTNTTAITVTVHLDVYIKIQDETNAEWHALLASAQAKNISFATV